MRTCAARPVRAVERLILATTLLIVPVIVVAYLVVAVFAAKLFGWLDRKYGPPEWSKTEVGGLGFLWPVTVTIVAVFGLCKVIGHLAGERS